jgi:hypothetical protein
MSDSSLARRD